MRICELILRKSIFTLILVLMIISSKSFCNSNEEGQASCILDIAQTGGKNSGSMSGNFTKTGNFVFFTAFDDANGIALWRTDLNGENCQIVKDIYPDYGSIGDIKNLIEFNGILFFTANDDSHGIELWCSDGTSGGTFIVKDINPGVDDSEPESFTIINNTLFFTAITNQYGRELWKTDGTRSGTALVKDISPGLASGNPKELTPSNGILYFSAQTPNEGNELWRSDGTENGTYIVQDIRPGSLSAMPQNFEPAGSNLFFSGYNANSAYGLFVMSETNYQMTFLTDLDFLKSSLAGITCANNTAYFVKYFSSTGYELWKSDGTITGTVKVKSLQTSTYYNPDPQSFTIFQNKLFFVLTSQDYDREIWISDGNEASTQKFLNINPGEKPSNPHSLTVCGNMMYFIAETDTYGMEVWKTDGSIAGTSIIKDIQTGLNISSYPARLRAAGDRLFFRANNGVNEAEPWVSDGTTAGTKMIMDINNAINSSNPKKFAGFDSKAYFAAELSNGQEAWITDGTTSGTKSIKNTSMDPAKGEPENFCRTSVMPNTVYFTDNFTSGTSVKRIIWKTDMTTGNTQPYLNSINAIQPSFFLTASNNKVFSIKSDSSSNLSAIDPETNISTPIGSFSHFMYKIFPANNVSCFLAGKASNDLSNLWATDGTAEGTISIFPSPTENPGYTALDNLSSVNSTVFFTINSTDHYNELWKSRGSKATTVMTKKIGLNTSPINEITNANGNLFFLADDNITGEELWFSDTTPDGTRLVKDITPGVSSSVIENPYYCGNYLYFKCYDTEHGFELWKSDGSSVGTGLVADINPGETGSSPANITPIPGTSYFVFTAYHPETGNELYVSDGTPSGTKIVCDIYPGINSSRPEGLTIVNNYLVFAATNPDSGRELWGLTLSILPEIILSKERIADHILDRYLMPYDLLLIADENKDGIIDIADITILNNNNKLSTR